MQICFKPLALALLLGVAPVLCAPVLAAPAAAETDSNFDPAAVQLFDRAVAAYAALDGLSLDFVTTQSSGGKPARTLASGNWAFLRPGKFRLEITKNNQTRLLLSNGPTVTSQTGDAAFQSEPLETPMMAQSAGAIPGAGGFLLLLLMTGDNSRSPNFSAQWSRVQLRSAPDFDVLEMTTRPPNGVPEETLKIYLEPKTHLLARVESAKTRAPQNTPQQTAETKFSVTTFASQMTKVVPALFEFQTPPGATLTALNQESVPAQQRFAVGDKPLEFREKTLDGRSLSLNDYRGKVVLLDFWATSCSPCVAELPAIQSYYNKYRAQGFEVVGISLDDDEATLRAWVKARNLAWPQLFGGGRPENRDAQNYGVYTIPFTLLIGKDGVIAAVNPQAEALEPAIQAALAH